MLAFSQHGRGKVEDFNAWEQELTGGENSRLGQNPGEPGVKEEERNWELEMGTELEGDWDLLGEETGPG